MSGFDHERESITEYVLLLDEDLYVEDQNWEGPQIVKIGETDYSLNSGEKLQVRLWTAETYNWPMENGFYYLRIQSLNENGIPGTLGEQFLLALQPAADRERPLVWPDSKARVPVLKDWPLSAAEVLDDGEVSFAWDIKKDQSFSHPGPNYLWPASEDLGFYQIPIRVSDASANQTEYEKQIEVYAPKIVLDRVDETGVQGHVEPPIAKMPFVLLRNRNQVSRLLYPQVEGRFFTDEQGNFQIQNNQTEQNWIIRDKDGQFIASVDGKTGKIHFQSSQYRAQAIAATAEHPTQILILNAENEIVARVSYISAGEEVIIDPKQIEEQKVNVWDKNSQDGFQLVRIPASSQYFPQGAAIIGADKQVQVAISASGAIRILNTNWKIQHQDYENYQAFQILVNNQIAAEVYINPWGNEDLPVTAKNSSLWLDQAWADEAVHIDDYLKTGEKSEDLPQKLDQPFKDLNADHPAYQAIIDLYNRNILKGYSDGTYHPEAKISRAEFVKIALGATNCLDCSSPDADTKALFAERKPFPDIYLTDWHYYCVSIGKKEKMVTGYGDGLFRAEKNISRKEAVAVLLRQIGAELEEMPANYWQDVSSFDWAKDYVYTAAQLGIIKPGPLVFPNEEITRGEFAMMASRVLSLADCKISAEYGDTHLVQVGKNKGEEGEEKALRKEKNGANYDYIYANGLVVTRNKEGKVIEKKRNWNQSNNYPLDSRLWPFIYDPETQTWLSDPNQFQNVGLQVDKDSWKLNVGKTSFEFKKSQLTWTDEKGEEYTWNDKLGLWQNAEFKSPSQNPNLEFSNISINPSKKQVKIKKPQADEE
ncbi:MAG TPA: S-layer homology domain-containing protein, partial [Candidatus Gracilibacteria bacterium]|nr:S-layer homology domain-containing protein [Candidatus Gracilibacteria bacterium]